MFTKDDVAEFKTVDGEQVSLTDAERQAIADEWNEPRPLDEIKEEKSKAIKAHGLSLIQSQIPAIDSFAMVAFLKTLWPTLTLPGSQTDLAYARDVYLYAVGKLDKLETATRAQIEGYDPATDPNWP